MPEIQIQKFDTRYRLPYWALAEQRRLDGMRTAVLDQAFALALERLGVADDGELCIRNLFAQVHLNLDGTDESLTRKWSLALAEEIGLAMRHGATSNVVVYHSRRQAMMDLAISVSRGDLRRGWAWRQLGLWRSRDVASKSQAISELVRSLCAETALVVPVLRALAEAGALDRIAVGLSEWQWEELALAALSERGPAGVLDEASYSPSPRALRDALLVLKRSLLLGVIASSRPFRDASPAVCRALAVLAVLDVEPMLLRTETVQAVIGIVADAVRSGRNETIKGSDEVAGPAVEQLAESMSASAQLAESMSASAQSVDSETAAPVTPGDTDTPELSHDPARRTREVELGKPPYPGTERDQKDTKPTDLRQRALTPSGGLLFLLGVVEDLKLPEEVLAHPALGARRFLWVIHQLALALADIHPNDPAALAFAGLPPQAKPPSDDEEAPSEIEALALNSFVARIVESLRSLLEREDDPNKVLLEFVCSRCAEVVAEPGWIEVRFSLDDVSTEIRRAGLDLDPGYLPWLGVVVKFIYE